MKDISLDKVHNLVKKKGLPDLNQTWFMIVRRNNSPFIDSLLRFGSVLRNPKLEFDNRMKYHLVLSGDIYASKEDFDHLKNEMIEKAKKDNTFLERYFRKVIEDTVSFVEWAKKESRNNFSEKTDKELIVILREFIERALELMSHVWPPLGTEEWILEEIEKRLSRYIDLKTDFDYFKEAQTALVASEKLSNLQIRKEELLKLAAKKDLKKKDIEKSHKELAWITNHDLWFKFETIKNFEDEVKELAKKEPEKQLRGMRDAIKDVIAKRDAIISKFKFDNDLLKFCNHAAELPHVRFARVEGLIHGSYILSDFFEELRKRIGIKDIGCAYFWEIEGLLKDKSNIKNIEARQKSYSFILAGKEFYDLDEETANQLKEKIEYKLNKNKDLKGQTACTGKEKGIVRVLRSPKDNYKVNKGDILVTSMTTPDYVPAMERAAAFVTDEGGLTCHAAIVSREMKKPCIVGTKNATKILKDGDLVEVDANKGIVKRIR